MPTGTIKSSTGCIFAYNEGTSKHWHRTFFLSAVEGSRALVHRSSNPIPLRRSASIRATLLPTCKEASPPPRHQPLTCFCLFFLQNCHLYCSLGYAIRAQGNDLRHSRRRPALQRPPPWRVCRPIPDHDRRQALRDARHVRSFCVLRLDSYFCAEHPTRARAQHNTTRTTQHPADIQCVCGYILYIYINRPSSCVVCADRHVVWHVVCHHAANATPIPRRRI